MISCCTFFFLKRISKSKKKELFFKFKHKYIRNLFNTNFIAKIESRGKIIFIIERERKMQQQAKFFVFYFS